MSELTWDTLYIDHADAYEVLVSHEDYQGNLLRAIQAVQPLAGKNSAEFGCGTGLLAGSVRKLHAFDFTASMLRLAWARLHLRNWTHVSLTLADSRRMPVRSGWADFAIEGCSFLQIAVWHPDDWQDQLRRALAEMRRVVRPDGKLILIETLGTGESAPKFRPSSAPSTIFWKPNMALPLLIFAPIIALRSSSKSAMWSSRSSARKCSIGLSRPMRAGFCRNVPACGGTPPCDPV